MGKAIGAVGSDEGRDVGSRLGSDEGYDEGFDEGYDEGFDEGYDEGREDGSAVGASNRKDHSYTRHDPLHGLKPKTPNSSEVIPVRLALVTAISLMKFLFPPKP